ncbi:MAG TPA: galactose ABC transporter substrate-binding protein [Candidatus Anaerobutyricum stercoris]|uniref:D-galactose/methyl-galactoside binding periplasmic protein MglB n=1 Tax=Candidatus Anaerobutyricum stercoris TaxID=2838457 RepID=A0A9D2J775_9FIRM|nr:D-galactose-binding periplasmic protein precursor [Eubacteriaceae bacterium CHKCI004]HIZ39216.1 galactose ABC transporter substrate-binding protein [Candidatus Anaerobutyricum stercoris]
MKKTLLTLFLCGVGMFCLCSCGEVSGNTSQKVQVGVAYYNQTDTFVRELIDCFKNELETYKTEDLEVTAMVREAAGLEKTQNEQVKELIDAGCNVLCVNLVDRADPSEIIDTAREHDIPLIFFNREPVTEDMMQWEKIYYVGAIARQSGELQGEMAAEVIKNGGVDRNGDGKIQYVILEGEADHQDAIIRTENVVNTLNKEGINLEKLSYQIANWNRAQAENRMKQMIRQYNDEVELVLSNNDDMAAGAVDAYDELNYTEDNRPVFFGVDGTSVGLQAVKDGDFAGTVYNDKEGQASVMAELSVALATGGSLDAITFENERYVYLPYLKVTADNVDEFLNRK